MREEFPLSAGACSAEGKRADTTWRSMTVADINVSDKRKIPTIVDVN